MISNVKAAIGLLAGLAIGWLLAGLYADTITVPAARKAGAQSERISHEEQRRKAEAQADQDRRAAQVRIDAIERVYHERTAEQAAQLDILEASIVQETAHAQAPTQALPQAGGGACPAAVPRSLRDALARVGASAPRERPAGPPFALR